MIGREGNDRENQNFRGLSSKQIMSLLIMTDANQACFKRIYIAKCIMSILQTRHIHSL